METTIHMFVSCQMKMNFDKLPRSLQNWIHKARSAIFDKMFGIEHLNEGIANDEDESEGEAFSEVKYYKFDVEGIVCMFYRLYITISFRLCYIQTVKHTNNTLGRETTDHAFLNADLMTETAFTPLTKSTLKMFTAAFLELPSVDAASKEDLSTLFRNITLLTTASHLHLMVYTIIIF